MLYVQIALLIVFNIGLQIKTEPANLRGKGIDMNKKKWGDRQSINNWGALDYIKKKTTGFETCWGIRPGIGTGLLKEFRFKSGLTVFLHNYQTSRTLASYNNGSSPCFGFRFCLSGHTILNLGCYKKPLTVKSGDSGFFYSPDMISSHEDMPETHIHKALILIKPSLFFPLLEEEGDCLPFKLNISPGSGTGVYEPYHDEGVLTPSMRVILQQLFACPYEGAVRRIFIEGKAMELIACKLDQIRPTRKNREKDSSVRSSDADRFHFAGELLLKNLSSPPDVMELARTIGVSRTKLYHGFNQLFGVSPMEYLRIKRIEKAKLMIKNKDLSMTQIAYTLGYSSSSHFAKAFRDFFGMPPSYYRQNEHV